MKLFLSFVLFMAAGVSAQAACQCTKQIRVEKVQAPGCRGSMEEGPGCSELVYQTTEYFVASMASNHREYVLSSFTSMDSCKAYLVDALECK
jgi:hypothetical protein